MNYAGTKATCQESRSNCIIFYFFIELRHLQFLKRSANKNKLYPFELTAWIHAKLTWIHPFEDGNGRAASTVMNFILMKKSFPMFFIHLRKEKSTINHWILLTKEIIRNIFLGCCT